MFPVGGGIAHEMFAYNPGGNLVGAREVFVGFGLATLFIAGFLRWTRYPAPWYVRAALASAIALSMWVPWLLSASAGPAFRRQGQLLAPILPALAFSASAWSHWRHGRPRRPARR